MSQPLVFIVEDEQKIAQVLVDYLEQSNYQTTTFYSGEGVVGAVRDQKPDFIILDVMLPVVDGLTLCKDIRKFSQVPIMMLTARVDEIDRLLGLEFGADDYVCKPFLPREVVARVKTILRRIEHTSELANSEQSQSQKVMRYREVVLDADQFRCEVAGNTVILTPVEFALLQTMLAKPGRVFSRELLMRACYDDMRVVSNRTIDSHIKNLRKKIDAESDEDDLIHSIYGLGYKVE
ncbi:response regulator [Neiella marina]|uniref:Response regulator n=1 Tax=Neiella holothuriorum TaxID=2870530 RepID=A0ABS7EER1_9GAMM|nr:response regulator [Neiella holothuriorum]MBW8190177.1 response regulator [Neiella holothuriorum]